MEENCGDWTFGGINACVAGELQRHAIAGDFGAGRNSKIISPYASDLRAGHESIARRKYCAGGGVYDRGRKGGIAWGIFYEQGVRWPAVSGASRPVCKS